jgi:N-acetylmuramoyl-L-alanine amidase
MLKPVFILILLVAGSWAIQPAQALPAPSSLSAREHRLNAATPTPTPTPVIAVPATSAPYVPTSTTAPYVATSTTAPVVRTSTTARVARPTRSTASQAPRQSTTIVIDPGHGGFDRGGISRQRIPESVMNLDVALRLRSILQAAGYRVVMTRDTDVFIPLGTRVAIGNSYRDAIFVCIHFNATGRSAASGVETYFYSPQSLALASAIHYYVAGGAPTANRGVRRRGFFVLRRTTIPSVLVECGFLTNPTEGAYVQNANYRQKLAMEIAHGIQNRSSVARFGGTARIVSNSSDMSLEPETVPLQPFIDQTHYRDPDLTRSGHKRGSKSSKSTSSSKSKHKKSSETASSGKSSTRKKKSASQAED